MIERHDGPPPTFHRDGRRRESSRRRAATVAESGDAPQSVGVVLPSLTPDVLPLHHSVIAEFLELLGSADVVVFLVSGAKPEPALGELCRRLGFLDAIVCPVAPELVDPESVWFRLFAAPNLRRLELPADHVEPGYYVCRRDRLIAWQPITSDAASDLDGLLAKLETILS